MATDGQSSLKRSQYQRAGTPDDSARPTVFQRMRELRKRGQSLAPAPITLVEEQYYIAGITPAAATHVRAMATELSANGGVPA